MITNIKSIIIILLLLTGFNSCRKTDYSFGNIKTPSNITITTNIQGANTANPTGDGSGNITVSVTATDAITYKIYFGNGDSVLTPLGTASYKYTVLDTNTYTITVNAIGTAGAMSSLSKQVKVLYKYQIPANILANLTKGTSKTWPNEKPSCAYGSMVTFTQVGTNGMTINDNNGGSSFLIGAATSFYGQSGGDGCYPITTGGTKTLGFSAANSGSNSSNSTGVQFTVPGNGIIGFGTGGSTYEIISLSSTVMMVRNIGSDGNAWYQILKAQ